jgi:hypothetical protein
MSHKRAAAIISSQAIHVLAGYTAVYSDQHRRQPPAADMPVVERKASYVTTPKKKKKKPAKHNRDYLWSRAGSGSKRKKKTQPAATASASSNETIPSPNKRTKREPIQEAKKSAPPNEVRAISISPMPPLPPPAIPLSPRATAAASNDDAISVTSSGSHEGDIAAAMDEAALIEKFIQKWSDTSFEDPSLSQKAHSLRMWSAAPSATASPSSNGDGDLAPISSVDTETMIHITCRYAERLPVVGRWFRAMFFGRCSRTDVLGCVGNTLASSDHTLQLMFLFQVMQVTIEELIYDGYFTGDWLERIDPYLSDSDRFLSRVLDPALTSTWIRQHIQRELWQRYSTWIVARMYAQVEWLTACAKATDLMTVPSPCVPPLIELPTEFVPLATFSADSLYLLRNWISVVIPFSAICELTQAGRWDLAAAAFQCWNRSVLETERPAFDASDSLDRELSKTLPWHRPSERITWDALWLDSAASEVRIESAIHMLNSDEFKLIRLTYAIAHRFVTDSKDKHIRTPRETVMIASSNWLMRAMCEWEHHPIEPSSIAKQRAHEETEDSIDLALNGDADADSTSSPSNSLSPSSLSRGTSRSASSTVTVHSVSSGASEHAYDKFARIQRTMRNAMLVYQLDKIEVASLGD